MYMYIAASLFKEPQQMLQVRTWNECGAPKESCVVTILVSLWLQMKRENVYKAVLLYRITRTDVDSY